jgi:hypothetical protein
MRLVTTELGPWLRRLPDGETGPRSRWARWQAQVFDEHPAFRRTPRLVGNLAFRYLPEAHAGKALAFPPLGYATAAHHAYEVLTQLRQEGLLPADIRLQVSLPTPLAVVALNLTQSAWDAVLPAYHKALLDEIDAIRAVVPERDLAIQWDVAVEMFRVLDAGRPAPAALASRVIGKLVRLGNEVPDGIELGYHLCYGDPRRPGYRPPADASVLAAVAASLLNGVRRHIDWLHMPVPAGVDEDWFTPLRDLPPLEPTELYLGLVNLAWGVDGVQRMIAAASTAVPSFGVATACGVGRAPAAEGGSPTTFQALLRLHAALADPVR